MTRIIQTSRGNTPLTNTSIMTSSESYIPVDTSTATGNIVITLRDEDIQNEGGLLIIKDVGGNANQFNIIIVGESGQPIDGKAAVGIITPYGSITFKFRNGNVDIVDNSTEVLVRSIEKINITDVTVTQDIATWEDAVTLSWDGTNKQFRLQLATGVGGATAFYKGGFVINGSIYPISTQTGISINIPPGYIYLSNDGILDTTYNMVNNRGDGNNYFLIDYIWTGQRRTLRIYDGMIHNNAYSSYWDWAAYG